MRAHSQRTAVSPTARGTVRGVTREIVARFGSRLAGLTAAVSFALTAAAGQAPGPVVVENTALFEFDGGSQQSSAFFTRVPAVDPAEIQLSDDVVAENDDGANIGLVVATNFGNIVSITVDDPRFEVVGGQLRLVDGATIDFENEPFVDLIITVTDDDGPVAQPVRVDVVDVNEPPFNLAVDNNFVPADDPSGPVVGELLVEDVDDGDTHTYTTDDDRFVIEGNVLRLVDGVTLDTDDTVTVTVVATDSGGLTTTADIEVTTDPGNVNVNPTDSMIALLQPGSQGEPVEIPPSMCTPAESFGIRRGAPAGNVVARTADLTGPQLVTPAQAFAIGDPIIVRVEDADQNVDPRIVDLLTVTVSAAGSGDVESVVLSETGPDTGVFVGFVDSTSLDSLNEDCVLTVSSQTDIEAAYVDPDDDTDRVLTTAPIAPVGIVFDDQTGQPVNGIILTLVDVVNGGPAIVLGDGPTFAPFPSVVRSGLDTTDSAGLSYLSGPGEYRFPAVPDGDYRIEVFNDIAYEISTRPEEELQLLRTGGFSLRSGSRGGTFHVQNGSLPRIDIPLTRVPETGQIAVTPSQIEFMQFSANPTVGRPFNVGTTTCVGETQRQVSELRDVNVPVPGTINLVAASVFKAGQPIFVRVVDVDQNRNPDAIESIVIELQIPSSDDLEFLELLETGPDTGEFIGYVQSTEQETPVGDCELSVVKNETIQTVYTDAFDNTDISDSLVLVDPFGLVFSTRDGELQNAVTITLVNADTGEPAQVFGDGPLFGEFPSTIVTGSVVEDGAGLTYDFPDGEYRFPFVEAGNYQLIVADLPEAYHFPSAADEPHIQQLPGAPYSIADGSRGEVFEVPVGPALHIDLPVDPVDNVLYLTKAASTSVTSVGEFVQYKLGVQNQAGITAAAVTLLDTLPPGFRYQAGSLRVDDVRVADPAIGPAGRELRVDLGGVAAGAPLNVSYVVEVSAGARLGEAVNTATAFGATVAEANVATASVFVAEDLMRSKAVLLGKVIYGPCDADPSTREGLGGVRLLTEDGTTVLTDSDGNWHIEGVTPGTHVVQLDVASLPGRYEILQCAENTRFAGRSFSQFVDVQGGTLWRADFYVGDAPDPETDVELAQTITLVDDTAQVHMTVDHDGSVELNELSVFYRLPRGWKLDYDSVRVNGVNQPPIESIVGLKWPVGVVGRQALEFSLHPKGKRKQIQVQSTVPAWSDDIWTFRPTFATRSAVLGADDREALARLAADIKSRNVMSATVIGHSDNVPIAAQNRHEYADNYALSQARAESVAQAFAEVAEINPALIDVAGAGPDEPIASNSTRDGRRTNRRVEIKVTSAPGPRPAPARAAKPAKTRKPAVSRARLRYVNAASPKGKSDEIKIDMADVEASGSASGRASGKVKGSWARVADSDLDNSNAKPEPGIVSLKDGDYVSNDLISLRLILPSELLPHIYIDDREIGQDRLGVSIQNPNTGQTTYTYIGVQVGDTPGKRVVRLIGEDREGAAGFDQSLEVWRTGKVESLRLVGLGENFADGVAPVVAYLQLLDAMQRPVFANVELEITEGELSAYTPEDDLRAFEIKPTVSLDSSGVVRFQPVTRAGVYRVRLVFGEIYEEIEIPVKPADREWVLVGLAEGTIGANEVSRHARDINPDIAEDYYQQGRLAFYAKGQVLGRHLLTLAYDTDKQKDNSVFQKINPGTYYTLYGDASTRSFDAASQEKLFVRVESDAFNATLGDFSTNLSVTELNAYSRALTGLYGEYYSDRLRANAFAAQTSQSFLRSDIQGNGTSGIYRLGANRIVMNSERIRLETRDRFQNTEVVETRALTRGLDYNIDYDRGEVIFKQPVFSQDEEFNPVFIVAEYETSGSGAEDVVAGGRVGVFFNGKKGEVGTTYVRDDTAGREQELAGVDLTYKFSETIELRAEVAQTESMGQNGAIEGSAYEVEFEHQSGSLDVAANIRDQDAGFGIGQQSGVGSGTRQAGVSARYKLNEETRLLGSVSRDEDKLTGRRRDVVQSSVAHGQEGDSLTVGMASSIETGGGRPDAESHLAQVTTRRAFMEGRLEMRGNLEAPLDTGNDVEAYPTRVAVGGDYRLTEGVRLRGEQEFSFSDAQDTQTTRVGLVAAPWSGAEAQTSVQSDASEGGEAMFANFGLRQVWEATENWTFDFGVDRSQTLRRDGGTGAVTDQVNPNAVPVRGNTGGDFTALFAGANYRTDVSEWVGRVEQRMGEQDDQWAVIGGYKRELQDGVVVAGLMDLRGSEGAGRSRTDGRLGVGFAYRPDTSRWAILNKLEYVLREEEGGGFNTTSRKIVNNLNANYKVDEETQVSLQYAFKYVLDTIDGDEYSGFTDLIGAEVRRNLSARWDIGLHASVLNSRNSGVTDFAYGVSVGHQFATNAWASVGYNFEGIEDNDFDESDYTTKGVYLKVRFKFDQNSARQVFRRQDVLE